ncbi:MAG: GGDEF domain-containing protein [Pseudomonadota bacterium]
MAEPADSKPNLANPTEVAREALRRLAMRRIAPTPDNYQTLYDEIVGKAAGPSAAGVLAQLVKDLAAHHPALSARLASLGKAVEKSDWRQCSWQLAEIVQQLKPQPARPAASLVDEPGDSDTAQLRELLAKTLEFGVASQLGNDPRLADKALKLAESVRAAVTPAQLREAASALKSLWVGIELQSSDARDMQDILKRVLLLVVENIGELLDDDSWLRGQLDMVEELLAGPLRVVSLQEAEKRLKEVIYKQGLVKHSLKEATATLKATMTAFVDGMGTAVAVNEDYQKKVTGHAERIRETEDVIELNRIFKQLVADTYAAQAESQRAQQQLVQQRDTALAADARIRQLEAELAQMSALVREDPLTRSLNRRGLDEEFAREVARADRYQAPLCVAVLDLDNFKALNDRRGHQAGDDALVHLVKVAKEQLRLTDHVARLGGEEFLIMMPNTPLDEAAKIMARLQRQLTKKYFLADNEKVLITFSAGVAERVPGETQDALIGRADAAMYEAKRQGKNRVVKAPPPVGANTQS